jgi:4-hydroxy-3-methylbut-2-enyl diphosphate reductase IspH
MRRRTARRGEECCAWRDLVLVVGSRNSSNSNRLVEVSKNLDTNSFLIDTADAIQAEWLEGVEHRCCYGRCLRS